MLKKGGIEHERGGTAALPKYIANPELHDPAAVRKLYLARL